MTTAWSTPMTFFSATRVSSSVSARIAKPALAPQLAGGASAAAIAPVMPVRAIAHVAGVRVLQHDPHQLLATDVAGKRESLRLVDPHQRRMHYEALLHPEIERDLQRLQRV